MKPAAGAPTVPLAARSAPAALTDPPKRALANVVLVAAVLGAWVLVARADVGGRPLIAGPLQTAQAMADGGPQLAADLLATLGRAAAGLALGGVVGAVLGLLAATLGRAAPLFETLLDFARSVPPVVLLPVFLLALGYGDSARVATIAAGCAAILAVSVATAASARSPRSELLGLYGASWRQRLWWTQPWESLPTLASGLRIAAATAVVVATVTEMVAGAPYGVGARIVSAQVAGQTPQLTAAVVVAGVAGWALNAALRALERGLQRRLAPSREGARP
jgi:NitT/TauT family transport system permease protein